MITGLLFSTPKNQYTAYSNGTMDIHEKNKCWYFVYVVFGDQEFGRDFIGPYCNMQDKSCGCSFSGNKNRSYLEILCAIMCLVYLRERVNIKEVEL